MSLLNANFSGFKIGSVSVESPFILAPMDGISDSPFRLITRQLGSSLSYTEFINAMDIVNRAPNREQRYQFSDAERPIVFQFFDENPERIHTSTKTLAVYQPDIIDINMGCSIRKISNRGAGAGLLKEPQKIIRILSGLVKMFTLPITIKIRLGWDEENINYLEIGKIAQDCGVSAIALHGRTRTQLFSGSVDWDAIAQLKQSLSIPVIGNGDLRTVCDAQRMLRETGCDAVMIGRAAISNPWIFAGYDLDNVPKELFLQTIRSHLYETIRFHGAEKGCIIFRKFAKRYFDPYIENRQEMHQLLTQESADSFQILFEKQLQKIETCYGK